MSCPSVSSDVGDRDRIGPMLGQINIVFNFGAWFISHLSLEILISFISIAYFTL